MSWDIKAETMSRCESSLHVSPRCRILPGTMPCFPRHGSLPRSSPRILAPSPNGRAVFATSSHDKSTPIPLTRKLTHSGHDAASAFWSVAKKFIAGTAAGVAECFVGHPLDTLKVRMQAAAAGQAGGTVLASGVAKMSALELLRSTIKHEGVLALYRGASSRVLGSALGNSVLFGANGAFLQAFQANTAQPLSGAFVLASAFTGVAEAAIWTPMDLLKTRCQVEYGKKVDVTPLRVARQLFQDRGVRALYAGGGPTLLREIVGNAIYFTVYQVIKQALMQFRGLREGDAATFVVAGGCAGTAYWFSIFPLDTVKSIVQAQEAHITGMQVARDLYAKGGVAAFYKGVGPAMLRAFPACAATWTTFEYSLMALKRLESHCL